MKPTRAGDFISGERFDRTGMTVFENFDKIDQKIIPVDRHHELRVDHNLVLTSPGFALPNSSMIKSHTS